MIKSYLYPWALALIAVSLFACEQEVSVMEDHSKTYYNGDMGLVSENGTMLFVPKSTLMKGSEVHEGHIWVDLAPHEELVAAFAPDEENLIQAIQNPKDLFVLRTQKDSLISDLHIANGKEILLFIPFYGKQAEDFSLISSSREWEKELFPNGFMDAERHLRGKIEADYTVENVERFLFVADEETEKYAANTFLENVQSFKESQDFLSANWELSQRRFKASQEAFLDEGDVPRKVGYYVLSMNYLRDPPPDSTLIYAFRDYLGEKAFVMMDWTGSMYQFRAELVEFLRHNTKQKKLKYLTFYNDLYCDFPREPGTFEGVFTHEDSFPTHEEASQLMHRCESSGSGGGELEENDLEAVLTSMERIKPNLYKEIALVIDNNAPPKDMILLPKIKIPKGMHVNIFVCRANSLAEVKEEYLDIARRFGGNIIVVSAKGIVKKSILEIDAGEV